MTNWFPLYDIPISVHLQTFMDVIGPTGIWILIGIAAMTVIFGWIFWADKNGSSIPSWVMKVCLNSRLIGFTHLGYGVILALCFLWSIGIFLGKVILMLCLVGFFLDLTDRK